MDIPVWLLDVDGVINANRPGWGGAPWTTTVYAEVEYKLRWEPKLTARIRRWIHDQVIDVRWCTTWCPNADLLERAWSLPPLVRCWPDEPVSPGSRHAAKVAAALAVIGAGRRLIWTDDEAIPENGPDRERLDAAGSLLIAPRSSRGLRPEHVDAIAAYAGLS